MEILFLVIGLIVGAVLGVFVERSLAARRAAALAPAPAESPELVAARHEHELLQLRSTAEAERAAALEAERRVQAELTAQVAAADAIADGLREQLASQTAQQRELVEQQRRDQAERQERERRESAVLQALSPVKAALEQMQTKVTELEQQRSTQYGSLAEQLKQSQLADEQLRSTTESLASALRSNSTRGVWGETQLRRVVEAAGLTQNVDFFLQSSISTDAGTGRPDMVVRLPGAKFIPLDAKVPLEHYLEASNIPVTATGEEGARRKALLASHVKAVRGHIDALAKKTYWEGYAAAPEFVIAFIPSESLLSSALEADPALLDYAFGKRVALASPVNLWAVLKTVDYAWQQQAVSDEAKKLFDLGNELYQRIGTLAGHADSLRRAIERTVDSYNKFASSLESRVLVTARKFPGINESKLDLVAEPAPLHEQPRRLAAAEFLEAEAADSGVRAVEAARPEADALDGLDESAFAETALAEAAFDGADVDPEIREQL